MKKLFNERMDDFWVYPKLTKIKHTRQFDDNFFDFLKSNNEKKTETNLYVHIPYCDSSCMFCPYLKNASRSELDHYVDAVVTEIKMYARTKYFSDFPIQSVHFGGGNPLLLSIEQFKRIVDTIKENFNIEINDNWTTEGSINCINDAEYVKGLLDLGINRVSFGIQTFKESIRKEMRIKATLEDIYHGVDTMRAAGLTEYCIDMMYNLPNQTLDDWIRDLELVTELQPYHIDIYNMALFPNTKLDRLVKKGDYFTVNPSNDNQLMMFEAGDSWLKKNGYRQIITNTYSKVQKKIHRGDEVYLKNKNVIGVGVSSRGYIDGYVYKNTCSISEYFNQINQRKFPANLSMVCTERQHNDRTMVFFPILMEIKKDEISNFDDYKDKIEQLVKDGLLKWDNDVLKLTQLGMPWSGNISSMFMDENTWRLYISTFLNALRNQENPYNEDKMGV